MKVHVAPFGFAINDPDIGHSVWCWLPKGRHISFDIDAPIGYPTAALGVELTWGEGDWGISLLAIFVKFSISYSGPVEGR